MRKFIEAIAGNECLDFRYKDYDSLFTRQKYNTYCLFFFLKEIGQLTVLKKEAECIFQTIKKCGEYDWNMDKNITCVLCLCVEEDEYYEMLSSENISNLSKTICFVEEDLNYFKKNVFLYTEKMESFARDNVGSLESLCQEYFTEKNFQSYKQSNRSNYKYDFLINLFIKIPFLRFYEYQSGNPKEYRSMETFVEARCREKAIDHEHIKELCGQLEKNVDNSEKLYEWLEALMKVQTDEKKGMAQDED